MTTITLRDLDDWKDFFAANEDAILLDYETEDRAFRHACDGGLILGGGAHPLFYVHFAD